MGLLMLRGHRRTPPIHTSAAVISGLSIAFLLTRILSHYHDLDTRTLTLGGAAFSVPPFDDVALTVTPLESKTPPYLPNRNARRVSDNTGLYVVDRKSGRCVFHTSDLARVEPHMPDEMDMTDVMLADGTHWRDGEILALGSSIRTAVNIGHFAQPGPGSMIDVLDQLPAMRKVPIHINNISPILDEDSS